MAALVGRAAQPAGRARIKTGSIVRDVALSLQGKKGPPIKRRFDVVILENCHLQVLICPALGERIVNVVDKTMGRKCLFEGTIRYLGNAYNEGGGSGGGIHINHPLYHAGSSYVAALPHTKEVIEDGTAVLTLAYTSYPHLQQTVWRISLRADEAAFRTAYRFENLAPYSMGFNPWIDATFVSSEDIQFTLPTKWVAGHWFGINPADAKGANGHCPMPWPIDADGADMSYLRNKKKDIAYSYFSYGLTGGYSGIYYHNANAGFAHVFDPRRMPGAKAYGAPAPYWCEIWGAFSHNMKDPRWLGPHETVEATDLWFPLYGTHGLTGRAPGCEPGKCRFESGRPTLSNGRRTFVIDDAPRTELRDCQEPWPRKELILALDGKQIGCHYIMHACLAPCQSE